MSPVVHCKKSAYDVYIGRPGPFGNPFEKGKDGNRKEVIDKFRKYLEGNPELIKKIKEELPGKILGCWCAPAACHGDVILEYLEEKTSYIEDL